MTNQKNQPQKNKHGFTIIEVVLVLAIAGLIFLMVFIALPALQRSQRDTQRRNDMARVATALTQYQSNNGGNLPAPASGSTTVTCDAGSGTVGSAAGNIKPNTSNTYSSNVACKFIAQYMNSSSATTNDFKDPDGTAYGVHIESLAKDVTKSATGNHTIDIYTGAACSGEQAKGSGNAREYAVLYKLEGAGVSCTDNK